MIIEVNEKQGNFNKKLWQLPREQKGMENTIFSTFETITEEIEETLNYINAINIGGLND